MAPRGNHGSLGRAFSVWRRRRPIGPSAGPFVGGARSKRFPGQYTIICVCCSVALTITEAHCYGAFAKRPVEFTPRFSQGARVLSDVRAGGSCHARRALGRSGCGGGHFLPRVLLRYLPAAGGRAAERVSRAPQAQCQSVAVSTDTRTDALRMTALAGASFPFLSDPDGATARSYGVFDLLGDGVATPATFIVKQRGASAGVTLASI